MTKLFDFIKARPYIIINACGLLLVLLCFFAEPLAYFGAGVALLSALALISDFLLLIFTTVFLLAVNVAAFYKTESGNPENGVWLSLLGGSVGAFAAVHTVNKKHEKAKIINVIFCIHLWILAYFAVSCMLYEVDYYVWSWLR